MTPYQAAVRSATDRLVERYEARELYRFSIDEARFWRHTATRFQRAVGDGSMIGLSGFVLGVAALVAVLNAYNPAEEYAGSDVALGAAAAGVTWFAVCMVGDRWLSAARLRLKSLTSAGMLDVFVDATTEIDAAVVRGNGDAVRVAEQVTALRPGLEELIEERERLIAARDSAARYSYRAGYRDALEARLRDVDVTILQILGELTAVASILFASRDDLLVQVAAADSSVQVELDQTRLSDAAQQALTLARAELAEIGEQLI